MTKFFTLLFSAILAMNLHAQLQFERVGGTAPDLGNIHDFEGVSKGTTLSADFNGDGFNDVLLAGGDCKLYLNDGIGNFKYHANPFPYLTLMHMTSGDVDGDGDLDLYFTGQGTGTGNSFTNRLFLNDGSANFTSQPIPNIAVVKDGCTKLIDLDNDSDLDLFVIGRDTTNTGFTEIYSNDGFGNFTSTMTTIENLRYSTCAFGDLDNDLDVDIVIAGFNDLSQRVVLTYLKTPTGYSLLANSALPGFYFGSLDLGDFDQDGDLDLLYTGSISGNNYASGLFANNGSGVFSATTASFIGANAGSGYFADIDNDLDLDVVINGRSSSSSYETEVYINTNGTYTNSGNVLIGSDESELLISDLNNDSFVDLIITGEHNGSSLNIISDAYYNNGSGVFNKVKNTPFEDFGEYSAHGDVDGDGDEDVVICGIEQYSTTTNHTRIYLNDGLGNYTVDLNNSLAGMRGDIKLIDFDSDGDMDIIICGNTITSYASPLYNLLIYKNNGTGTFSLWTTLPGVGGSFDWADVDGDSDLDVMITGRNNSSQPTTTLYLQDASNNFGVSSQVFTQLQFSAVHFFDCDNDNDNDVIILGSDGTACTTILYTNNGLGVFTVASGSSFTAIGSSPNAASLDVNNDGYLDLILNGAQCGTSINCEIYLNNGFGQFAMNQSYFGGYGGNLVVSDMNDDGYDDIVFNGSNQVPGIGSHEIRYLINTGSGGFTPGTVDIPQLYGAPSLFSLFDSDADGDNDLVIPYVLEGLPTNFFRNITGQTTCTPTASTDIQSACDSYTWIDGNTYSSSNSSAFHTLTNAVGCDSVVTLNLTVNAATSGTDAHNTCGSYTWIDGNTYTASNNSATFTLTNAAGCDSTVTLDLIINQPTSGTDVQSACSTYTWIDGNTYSSSNNSASFTVPNSAGCDSTIILNLTIGDFNDPVADLASLANITTTCGQAVTSLTAPTATDNCAGSISGTHNASLPITTIGTTTVTWTFDDGNGNTSTQSQQVIIEADVAAPVADVAALANITTTCGQSVTSLTAPTATDNCAGSISGTHNASLPITTIGTTTVTWTFDDGNGNTSTQTQQVIIDGDITAPVADLTSLSDITSQCSVTTLTSPTATDACAGSIIGTHNASLPITLQGTTTVTWTYDDGNGNTSTQSQNVILSDMSAPIAVLANLPVINSECEVSPAAPSANDNCAGALSGTPDISFPITASGTTVVTWTYDDGNGNTATQIQNVTITPIDDGITQVDPLTLSADAVGYSYQWVDCDNGNAPVSGATNQLFTPTVGGNYACEVSTSACTVTTACLTSSVGLDENTFSNSLLVYPNPTEGSLFIEFSEGHNGVETRLLDMSGRVVLVKQFDASENVELFFEGQSGIYFLEIENTDGQKAVVKVQKV